MVLAGRKKLDTETDKQSCKNDEIPPPYVPDAIKFVVGSQEALERIFPALRMTFDHDVHLVHRSTSLTEMSGWATPRHASPKDLFQSMLTAYVAIGCLAVRLYVEYS